MAAYYYAVLENRTGDVEYLTRLVSSESTCEESADEWIESVLEDWFGPETTRVAPAEMRWQDAFEEQMVRVTNLREIPRDEHQVLQKYLLAL